MRRSVLPVVCSHLITWPCSCLQTWVYLCHWRLLYTDCTTSSTISVVFQLCSNYFCLYPLNGLASLLASYEVQEVISGFVPCSEVQALGRLPGVHQLEEIRLLGRAALKIHELKHLVSDRGWTERLYKGPVQDVFVLIVNHAKLL